MMALYSVPLDIQQIKQNASINTQANWELPFTYIGLSLLSSCFMVIGMIVLFKDRWRLTGRG